MAKRILIVLAWGFAGLAVALGLTVGAFALAGQEIGEPATPPGLQLTGESRSPRPSGTRSPSAQPTPDDDRRGSGDDDRGGDDSGSDSSGPGSSNSGSGSDDSGGDDSDGDDNSGSGSDDSGGDNSGSGSDDGDDHDDDHDDD